MDIKVEVGPVTLDTPIGEHRIYDEDGDYRTEPVTLGEAIAKQVFADMKRDERYNSLREAVGKIRLEEAREQIRPIVEKAVAAPVQKTNLYGSPVGEPTTLTEMILDEARAFLTRRDDSYNAKDKRTYIEKIVAEAVSKTIREELSAVLAEEKAKVVAAVQAKAAELIAEAVKAGVGR